jgi:ATP-dependent DNA ligase
LLICQNGSESVGLDQGRDEKLRVLVAQIEFTEWTPNGRHSKFIGLRDDRNARIVARENEG